MKKIIHILSILTFLTYSVKAQTLTIVSQENQSPLEGVTLLSEHPQAATVSNIEGQADISAFAGAELIQIRSQGYKTQIKSFADLAASSFIIALEPSNLDLDEIVVAATRWRQASGRLPSTIISISAQEVALQNPQTAADLLGISGKVFIQKSQQGGGSPMIRGFATNRLIYTIDGIRMNTAIFRGGNIQNVINLDPFAVEHTEVMFGPGSVIYGSDAIGGVMSFQTLKPQLSLQNRTLVKGKALFRYASANNEQTGHFDINIGGKKWAAVTSFSSWDFDHLRQGSEGPDDYLKNYYVQRQDTLDQIIFQEDPLLQIPSAYSQINLMQKVRFKPNKNWDFQYAFHYSETSPYGRYDRHNRQRNGKARYAEWDYGAQSWLMNALSIEHQQANFLYDQMSLRIAQQSFEESRIDRDLNDPERRSRQENVEAYSLNADFIKSFDAQNHLFYGIEYVHNQVSSQGQIENINTRATQPTSSRYPQADWRSAAIYLNTDLRLSEQLSLQGGMRYNLFAIEADFSQNLAFFPFPFREAEVNNASLTGSVGLVYRPDDTWIVKTNFGTAFRAPNVDDLGKIFDSEPGAVLIPNPDLEAEYAYNVDIGVAKIIAETLRLELTAYRTNLQNALVRRDFQLNGQDSITYDGELSRVQAIQNAAVANVYGIQAGIELKLPAGFSLSSDFNYQVGEEELEDGSINPSRHAAPWFGVSRFTYKQEALELQFYAHYQGERRFEDLAPEEQNKDEIYAKDANGNNYSPAWYTLNFKARYSLNEHFQITAGIENLTDQRYRPYSSGISGAGRNLIFALQANF